MSVQQTSLFALEQYRPKIPRAQRAVYDHLLDADPVDGMTDGELSFGEAEASAHKLLELVIYSAERGSGSGGNAPTCGTREIQSIQAQFISGTGGNDETPCVSPLEFAKNGYQLSPSAGYFVCPFTPINVRFAPLTTKMLRRGE